MWFSVSQAVEFSKLVSCLRPDEPEDVIVSSCQKLTTFFHQRPEQKIVFITQHGLLPLMELLEVPRTRVCNCMKLNELLYLLGSHALNYCFSSLCDGLFSCKKNFRSYAQFFKF